MSVPTTASVNKVRRTKIRNAWQGTLLSLAVCCHGLLAAEAPQTTTVTVDNISPATIPAPTQSFADWLADFRTEASSLGISTSTLDTAFNTVVEPLPRIIELDRSQPEFVQTFTGYMRNRMSDRRIERGRRLLAEHKDLFAEIQRKYGIQPHYLAAFWALESNFGDETGGFSVINALATLAYDPRRADFFRGELLTALHIIDQGHIPANQMTGSWAGAMGQCQFMPSTFKAYAVDGDGDGRINIWASLPDVFASAGNYLSKLGWKADERWGREVVLPADFDFALSGTGVRKTVSEWNNLGVTRADGSTLGSSDIIGSVIVPAGAKGPAFLAYNNFHTILEWNRSTFYGIAVGHLADRFAGEGPIVHMPATEERALAREDVMELQNLLNTLGFDTGTPDGIAGSRTREAVRNYQLQNNLQADGYVSYDVLALLRGPASNSQQ
jgi:membrane-bound lytic murein transglycosylase B